MRKRNPRWLGALIVASLVVAVAGPVAAKNPKGRDDGAELSPTERRGRAYGHLMHAMFSMRNGEFRTAVDEIYRATELVPDSPDLLTEAAELLTHWTGRVSEGETMARRALELDAEHEGATRFLAELEAARALGPSRDDAARAEATRLYEKLAQGDTTDRPEILETLVRLKLQAGDLEGSLATVRRLVRERPGDKAASQTLAQLLLRNERGLEALEVLLSYATAHPADEEILGWAEQLANSQQAWPAVVDYLGRQSLSDRVELKRFYGYSLLRAGRMADAAATLEETLGEHPDDLRLRKDLALAYRGMGRMADAAGLFAELAAESPEYPFQQLLAQTLADQQDLEGALHAFGLALQGLDGEDEGMASHRDAIRQRIALLHLRRDEYGAAEEVLGQLEVPDALEALEIRCRLAIAVEKWDEARELARRLGDSGEEGPRGLAALLEGEILVREKRWARADDRLGEAIGLLGPYTRVNAAEIYRAADKPTEGLRLLREWVDQDAELADARFHLGVYYYELDRFEEAEHELREAFRLDPRHARALNFLGYGLAERKVRLGEALEMIERALEVDAWNGAYLDSLGWVYFQMGRFEEAVQPLERAARELPADPTVLEHLGDLYDSLGDEKGAVTAWNRALAAGPENPDTVRTKIRRRTGAVDSLAEDARASSDVPQR